MTQPIVDACNNGKSHCCKMLCYIPNKSNYDPIQAYLFLKHASQQWLSYVRNTEKTAYSSVVRDLTLKLIDPDGTHFDGFVTLRNSENGLHIYRPQRYDGFGGEFAVTIANLCVYDLLGTAKVVLSSSANRRFLKCHLRQYRRSSHQRSEDDLDVNKAAEGTQLRMALVEADLPYVNYLIEIGANVNALVDGGLAILTPAMARSSLFHLFIIIFMHQSLESTCNICCSLC